MRDNYQNRPNAPKAVTLPHVETTPVEDAAAVETPVAAPAAEAPEPSAKKDILGVVTGCSSLLIREKPDKNAGIVTAVPTGTELMVDRANSTPEFYKVCNAAGIEGFCMKRYVKLRA